MRKAFTLVEIMIVVVIIGLLAAMAIPAIDIALNGDRKARDQYSLWCKLEKRSDITFEEWKEMKRANLVGPIVRK